MYSNINAFFKFLSYKTNVFKTELVIEPEKFSVHSSLVESMIKPRLNQ